MIATELMVLLGHVQCCCRRQRCSQHGGPPEKPASRQARWRIGDNRWDEKAGLHRDALGSQVIDALDAREIEETGDEEAYHHDDTADI